jgi:anti-sigma B factor antagonist
MDDTTSSVTLEHLTQPDESVRLVVSGDVDVATAGTVLSSGLELLNNRQVPSTLALDLTNVTFIDSTGLGVLVSLRNAAGDDLVLLDPSERVLRLLDITGLTSAFTIERRSQPPS